MVQGIGEGEVESGKSGEPISTNYAARLKELDTDKGYEVVNDVFKDPQTLIMISK